MSGEYDMDAPLNEVDAKYWLQVSKNADPIALKLPLLMERK
jgi:hypothetical protein